MTAATMRQETAGKVRKLAAEVQGSHPTMGAHDHLRDAAQALDHANTEGAGRHLRAAIAMFTPLSLMRHGHLEDEAHLQGKQHMDATHRMLLLVKDAEDHQYREDSAREAKQAMNAPAGVPEGRPDGAARGPTASGPHRMLPARPWQAAAAQSAGPVLTSNVMDLAFNPLQPRDSHGRWTGGPGESSQYFAPGLHPGSFEHLAAIEDLGRRAATQITQASSQSPTMRNALHNVAAALARRDIASARIHMQSAHWANRNEAHGMWNRELADLDKQIGMVPKQETGFRSERLNPLSTREQHPGRMRTTPDYLALANQPYSRHPGEDVQCPHCGKYNMDDARFCDQCGRELPESAFKDLSVADWAQIYGIAIELSAQTARLAVTPAPRGRPGGPGLYHVQGLEHSPYLQQIVKALIEKRGMAPGKAYAIARASIRKWMAGRGHVHPEVRAAASGAEAQELKAQAQAHAHANDSAGARVIELFNPNHSVTGQFTTAQNAQQGKGKQGKGKLNTRANRLSQTQRTRAKGQLLATARNDIAKANALRAQIRALEAQLRGGSSKSGATAASSGATKASSAATKAAPGAAAKSGAAAGKSGTSSSSKPSSRSQIASRISALRGQVHSLMQAAHAAQAQAAKL